MRTFKIGGIHPNPDKLTAGKPIIRIKEPDTLTILLNQSIGKPALPIVKAGDEVEAGQLIAKADGLISANVHAPRSGKIKKLTKVRGAQGYWHDAIILECNPTHPLPEFQRISDIELDALSPRGIIDRVREAGIVGLGGAAFPTAVKLTPPPETKIDIVIINGAECEPYLTCDDQLMREHSEEIADGARLLMRALEIGECVIAIEANKPEAIDVMRMAVRKHPGMRVEVLKTKYPQGGEKQLITAITGRRVPSGKLPSQVGVIVDNVATAYAVYQAVYYNKPLIERVVTVTGKDLSQAGNYLVPVGVTLQALLSETGGISDNSALQVIAGGPMMGKSVSNIEAPTVKATSGLLVIDDEKKAVEQPCIRCGRCVYGCPMGLEPLLLIVQARKQMWPEMKDNNVMDCIECGSCSWSCPANKPLLDFIKLGKLEIRKRKL